MDKILILDNFIKLFKNGYLLIGVYLIIISFIWYFILLDKKYRGKFDRFKITLNVIGEREKWLVI